MGLQCVNWYGGRGGHLSFAPVLPQDGTLAFNYAKKIKAYYEEIGQDYYASFTIGRRHINNVSLISTTAMSRRWSPAPTSSIATCLPKRRQGFAEYRGHISYMDAVAATYNFGAARCAAQRQGKAALDPNNIIAPGRNGIGTRR
jgi:4-cresol dehydrogenase (hydroxylating)